jgi:telomeric repeat-binding factor 2-interacting protein 1
MGATHIPRKGTRTDFNLADDRILYDWVQEFEKTQDALSGNKIYQDLAAKVRTTDLALRTTTYR